MADAPQPKVNLKRTAVLLLGGQSAMMLLNTIFVGFGIRHPYRCFTRDKAMETCREADLDLIVCDGAMPDGEAYDFIRELRRSDLEPNRFVPVVVVTGHTPIDQVLKARDCGANFVVAKPMTPRVLMERVMWLAGDTRPFMEVDDYVGPDRRFQNLGPPEGGPGRRRSDTPPKSPTASSVNLQETLI